MYGLTNKRGQLLMHILGVDFINFKSILVDNTNAFTTVEFG